MKKWKIALAMFLVFIAGIVTGVMGTRMVVRSIIRRVVANPTLVREKIERDLVRKLKLDDSQRNKVHDVLQQSQEELRELQMDSQPRFMEIWTNAEKQIGAILTPEQQQKWEKLKAENRRALPFSPPAMKWLDSGPKPPIKK